MRRSHKILVVNNGMAGGTQNIYIYELGNTKGNLLKFKVGMVKLITSFITNGGR